MIDSRDPTHLHKATYWIWLAITEDLKSAGLDFRIVSTFRDFEKQDALYNQGRTAPGPVVTDARAGFSFHNVRRAVDAWPVDPTTGNLSTKFVDSPAAEPLFELYGNIGKAHGLVWGGDWKKRDRPDRPHLENRFCARCGTIAPTSRHFAEDGECAIGR